MEILYILIAAAAFFSGFVIGKNKKYRSVKYANKKGPHKITAELVKEYQNFLNYDGTEQ